jgi:hypothetical protein
MKLQLEIEGNPEGLLIMLEMVAHELKRTDHYDQFIRWCNDSPPSCSGYAQIEAREHLSSKPLTEEDLNGCEIVDG